MFLMVQACTMQLLSYEPFNFLNIFQCRFTMRNLSIVAYVYSIYICLKMLFSFDEIGDT